MALRPESGREQMAVRAPPLRWPCCSLVFVCVLLVSIVAQPNLVFVSQPAYSVLNHTTPGAQGIKYGIEGGTMIKSSYDNR